MGVNSATAKPTSADFKTPKEEKVDKQQPAAQDREQSKPVNSKDADAYQGNSDYTPSSGSPGRGLSVARSVKDDPSRAAPGTTVEAEIEVEAKDGPVPGLQGSVHASGSVTNSLTETDDQGRSWNKYTVDLQLDGGVGAKAGSEDNNLTQSGYRTGNRIIYDAKVPSGSKALPNPYDPSTIPDGGSVMVRDMKIGSAIDTEGQAGLLSAGFSYQHASGNAVSVENKDGKYRVSTGSTDLVENGLEGGFGNTVKVTGSIGETRTHDQMRYYEFDTPEAAREYIRTGIPPAGQQPGTVDRRSAEGGAEVAVQIEQELGPVKVAGSFAAAVGNNSSEITRTVDPSGKVTLDVQEMASNNKAMLYQSVSSDGASKSSMVQRDTDPTLAMAVSRAFTGSAPQYEGNQDIGVTVDQKTTDAIQNLIATDSPLMDWNRKTNLDIQMLQEAKTPEEMNRALFNIASRGQLSSVTQLLYLANGQQPIAPDAQLLITPSRGR